jgi:O-antigen ligase
MLLVLSVSIFLSLLFALVQMHYAIDLGNTTLWIRLRRINSTFKDPNSFGVILSSFLPLALGLFLSFRRLWRFFFLLLLILGLVVFPAIGSRSGFLGLGVSLVAFSTLSLTKKKSAPAKKNLKVGAVLIVAALLFLFVVSYRSSNLGRRIGRSLEALTNRDSIDELFTRKLELWKIAFGMIKTYPLTGVGLGSYIVDLPNWGRQMEVPLGKYTDSAENYFAQVGSEAGLPALAVMLWVFFEIGRAGLRKWKELAPGDRDNTIVIGAASGIASLFVNLFFHSYIGVMRSRIWLASVAVLLFFGGYGATGGRPQIRPGYIFSPWRCPFSWVPSIWISSRSCPRK